MKPVKLAMLASAIPLLEACPRATVSGPFFNDAQFGGALPGGVYEKYLP